MTHATIHVGDCLDTLRAMEADSVHCVVTSPPYFGLRDYGHPGQIGAEDSFPQYVETMREVFRCVWRVLREDGTIWLNLGDSYAGSWGNQGRKSERGGQRPVNGPMLQKFGQEMHAEECDMDGYCMCGASAIYQQRSKTGSQERTPGVRAKSLIGVPWRVALALQTDGWILRRDIVWHKPAPMPESIRDRCTTAHEYVFHMAKSPSYFYDGDAIREPDSGCPAGNGMLGRQGGSRDTALAGSPGSAEPWQPGGGRNARSVWTIGTAKFKGAHFATMPEELARRCILAGCPDGGTVLDPFAGAGTTGLVAVRYGRSFVGCEINERFAEIARKRIAAEAPLFATVEVQQ